MSVFMPPDSDVSALGKEYLEKRVSSMQEAVDREEWRQNDGEASRPEYWIGRLHEAKIAHKHQYAVLEMAKHFPDVTLEQLLRGNSVFLACEIMKAMQEAEQRS